MTTVIHSKNPVLVRTCRNWTGGKTTCPTGYRRRLWGILVALILTAGIGGAQEPEFHETFHAKVDPAIPAYKALKKVSGEMKSYGTETMEPLMNSWIEGFTKLHPGVSVQMDPWKDKKAGPAFAQGLTDFIPVSRDLLPSEVEQFQKHFGYTPTAIRVALGSYRTPAKTGALTFVVHESNPMAKLSLTQLDAMYCTGRKRGYKEDITTWGQLGLTGEWADRKIQLVGVIQPDGISNHIRLAVCRDGELKKGILEEKLGRPVSALERVVKDVSKDPGAIGYATMYYLKPGVKALAIAETEKGPYLMGSFEEVESAKFAMTRFIHMYANRAPGKPLDPRLKEFLRYILSHNGQRDVEMEGIFMPLPARVVKEELSKLQ